MIKRKIFKDLFSHCSKKEISLITGPRQSGKTTLMLMLKEKLEQRGQPTLYLNLDSEADKRHFSSQQALISKIKLEMGDKKCVVFIDEIQRKKDAGLFLKGLYDLNLLCKFVVSGSGSIELKEKIHESLAGRKRVFKLNTVSFEEFVQFRTDYKYEERIGQFFSVENEHANDLLLEYLNYGGYPRVILEQSLKEKTIIIDEIYHSYLERDIRLLLNVEKSEQFSSLITIMADQAGQLVNYTELASTIGLAAATIKKYLWYAQKTFVLRKLTPYYTNIRKELSKSAVIYFYDLGLRNYPLGLFGKISVPGQLGSLFQNLILNMLVEKTRFSPCRLHYWRTKDKAEVDFVLEIGKTIIPVEVKFKEFKKPAVRRSLRNFISRYHPRQSWVINISLNTTITIEDTEVHFISIFRFIEKILPL